MWRPINFLLHAIWLVVILTLLKDYHFVDPALYDAVLASKQREVFSLAVQLGRLDFLNSILAILSLVIAGGAIFGIIEVRKGAEVKAEAAAKPAATAAAEKELKRVVPPMVRRYVRDEIKTLRQLGDETVSDDEIRKLMQGLEKDGSDE